MSNLCDAVREDLSAYIDGMLSEDEAKQVEKHLAECEACKEEYQFLSGILKNAAAMPLVSVSDRFHAELHNKLVAVAESKKIKIRKRPIWQLASGFVATAAVIALSIVSFSNLPKQSELTPFVPTPSVKHLETNERMHTPVPTQAPADNAKQKTVLEQKVTRTVESPQPVLTEELLVDRAAIASEEVIPEMVPAEEPPITEQAEAANAAADLAVSGGGMARAAMPFVKTGMCYSMSDKSFSMALELLASYQQEGNGYLVPDEDLTAVCEGLEALEGYTGHKNIVETLHEPTDEIVALYSTHTLIMIEKSE